MESTNFSTSLTSLINVDILAEDNTFNIGETLEYLSLENEVWDIQTNGFLEVGEFNRILKDYSDNAKEKAITELWNRTDLGGAEKYSKMLEIQKLNYQPERFTLQVIKLGGQYFLSAGKTTFASPQPSRIAGNTQKALFANGDRVRLYSKQFNQYSETVMVSGNSVIDSTGVVWKPSLFNLNFRLTLTGETEEQFKQRYLRENGRPFTGLAGLSQFLLAD